MTMSDNWNLIGHEWAVELLKGHLKRGKPRHAYLITGPENVGRRTLALRYTQAINSLGTGDVGCFDPDSQDSQRIENLQHPDMSVVERQPGNRDIKIAQIRTLQQQLALSPYMSNFRYALLLNFEDANVNASNALLKTLEEPASQVVLILTAQSQESLLPTIVSRCEHIRLRPVKVDILREELQKRFDLSVKNAELYAHISGGRPGLAIRYIREPELLETRKEALDDLVKLINVKRVERFKYAKDLSRDKESMVDTLNIWQSFWRDVLIIKTNAEGGVSNIDRKVDIQSTAAKMKVNEIKVVLKGIDTGLAAIRSNVNPLLNAENLLLKFPIH